MLMTVEEVKGILGVTTPEYDDFLRHQINIISEAIEMYCSRKFLLAQYTQEFFRDEFVEDIVNEIYLYHYPVHSISSIVDGENEVVDGYRLVKPTGLIRKKTRFFTDVTTSSLSNLDSKIVVRYQAGYETLPYTLQSAITSLVGERLNKKQSGVDLNFGVDVQRISIPGTISVDYDYTLENNSQAIALGTILGNQVNILDQFKSERKVMGSILEGYVYS